jgi:hypothetical protein
MPSPLMSRHAMEGVHRGPGSEVQHHIDREERRWVLSAEAAGALVAGAGAATLTAWIDAASISVRVHGEAVGDRPTWMLGFGVAVFTVALGAWVLVQRTRPFHRATVALCAALAIANIAVAVVEVLLTQSGWVLPVAHTIAAGALVATIGTARHRSAT